MAAERSDFASLGFIGILVAVLIGVNRGAPPAAGTSAQGGRDTALVVGNGLIDGEVFQSDPLVVVESLLTRNRSRRFGMLIATVPDPIDSRGDWAFDGILHSIRRAHESSGFVMDRFWLPWVEDRALLEARTSSETRREYPGLMLFRHRTDADSLQLVFLVGEVPTSGVHDSALTTALNTWRSLRPIDERRPVRMIAPYYSGSAASIIRTIHGWSRRNRVSSCAFNLISGSATSHDLLQRFDTMQVRFRRTVHSDDDQQVILDTVLSRMGYQRREMAILVESSTGYGASLIASDNDARRNRRVRAERAGHPMLKEAGRPTCGMLAKYASIGSKAPAAPSRDSVATVLADTVVVSQVDTFAADSTRLGDSLVAEPDSAAGERAARVDTVEALRIPIPLGIASLRTAYERRNRNQQQLAPMLPGRQASPFDLSLADPDWPTEHPSTFATRLTPAVLDVLIDDIARLMVARRTRVVGILATDIRDKLFLAQEVRRRLPGVQLFTFESSVLYSWPAYQESLRGMLVVTTYPLSLELQPSAHREGAYEALPFSFASAEGVYNAVLAQFGDKKRLADYAFPGDSSTNPPIWVTAIGRDANVPVWVDRASSLKETGVYQATLGHTAWHGRAGLPWAQELWWPYVLALVLAAWLWMKRYVNRVQRLRDELEAIRGSAGNEPERYIHAVSLVLHWHLYAAFRAVALGSLGAVVAGALWAMAGTHHPLPMVLPPWLVGLSYAVYHSAIVLKLFWRSRAEGWRYAWDAKWENFRQRCSWFAEVGSRLSVFALLIALVAAATWYGTLVITLDETERRLFQIRTAALGSGLSVLNPLGIGFLGLALWTAWHLRRINLLAGSHAFEAWALDSMTFRPLVFESDYKRNPLAAAVAEIRMRLYLTAYGAPGWVLFLAMCVMGFALLGTVHRSIEVAAVPAFGWPVTVLLMALVGASFGGLAWGAIRLMLVWRTFRAALIEVCASPLLSAFERLPERVAALARVTLLGPSDKRTLPIVASAQWRQLVSLWTAAKPKFAAATAGAEVTRLGSDVFKASDVAPTMQTAGALSGERAATLRALDGVLQSAWKLEPAEPEMVAVQQESAKDLSADPERPGEVSTFGRIRRAVTTPERLWLRALEEFVALHFVEYAEWVIEHLRNMASFLVVGVMLSLMLVSSYTAYDGRWLQYACFAIMLGTVVMLLHVLIQLNRDEVLSRITKTNPGKVTWDARFFLNIIALVALPTVAILSSVFPAVREFLFSWVSPVLNTMSR